MLLTNEFSFNNKLTLTSSSPCAVGVAIGYSWLDGLLIEPMVRGPNPSGARVQWIRELLNPWSGVQTPSWALGCHTCPNRVNLGVESPGAGYT